MRDIILHLPGAQGAPPELDAILQRFAKEVAECLSTNGIDFDIGIHQITLTRLTPTFEGVNELSLPRRLDPYIQFAHTLLRTESVALRQIPQGQQAQFRQHAVGGIVPSVVDPATVEGNAVGSLKAIEVGGMTYRQLKQGEQAPGIKPGDTSILPWAITIEGVTFVRDGGPIPGVKSS